MLSLEKPMVVDGITVYRDHADASRFWYLPGRVALAHRSDGAPALSLLTYRPKEGPSGGGGGPGRQGLPNDPSQGGVTVSLRHSMVKLPEVPMRPRRYDDRVGFFTEGFEDYGNVKNHQVEDVQYITRWRLEKKDPTAEVSEPKKPIVFYLGREIPEKWRPWVRKGIEAWQDAFERAGFKNAIVAKDARHRRMHCPPRIRRRPKSPPRRRPRLSSASARLARCR